jgi:serine/threonine-protein kinase
VADPTFSEASGPRACPACGRTFPEDFLVCPRDGAPLGVAPGNSDPLIGVLLGNTYRVARVLARGGMGRLYEASHTRLPRKVAVKVLHEPHAQKRDAVRRFEREASALARIDSPHVLPALDFVRTPDGRGAIVTPLLEGEDLQSLVERVGALSPEDAVRIALEMCRGLAAAHAEGIVHRDLKPSNVFLARRLEGPPVVKLLDFGVAKLGEEDMTRTGVVLGTPAYMAPEQASGSARVGPAADVYGVGAVLYRMLAGRMPYDGDDAGQVLRRLLDAAPKRPSAFRPVPPDLEAVVQRAMARDPGERFPSVAALGEALEALTARRQERTSGPPRVGSLTRERSVGAALVLAAPACAGLTAAAVAWTGAEAAGASSETALAFVTALALVGSLGATAASGWALSRELRARWESRAELATFRARWAGSLGGGLAVLGAAALTMQAARWDAPLARLATLAVAAVTVVAVARRAKRRVET